MSILNIFKNKGLYANITQEQIQGMIKSGELKPLYLIGLRFGGSDKIDNIVYVPNNIVDQKDKIDDEIEKYMQEGKKIKNFNCTPTYKGKSSIPSKIKIQALIDDKEKIERILEIW